MASLADFPIWPVLAEEYDLGPMGKTKNGLIEVMGWKAAWFKDSEGNTIEIAERA